MPKKAAMERNATRIPPPRCCLARSVYSGVQTSRLMHAHSTRSSTGMGPPSFAAGNPDEIAKLFLNLFGQPAAASLVPGVEPAATRQLKVGVVLSAWQALGGRCDDVTASQALRSARPAPGVSGGEQWHRKCIAAIESAASLVLGSTYPPLARSSMCYSTVTLTDY